MQEKHAEETVKRDEPQRRQEVTSNEQACNSSSPNLREPLREIPL